MEEQRVKSKRSSQRDSRIRVVTNWQHTQEVSPAMRRLLMLLLRPRGNHPVETVRTDEERQNEP